MSRNPFMRKRTLKRKATSLNNTILNSTIARNSCFAPPVHGSKPTMGKKTPRAKKRKQTNLQSPTCNSCLASSVDGSKPILEEGNYATKKRKGTKLNNTITCNMKLLEDHEQKRLLEVLMERKRLEDQDMQRKQLLWPKFRLCTKEEMKRVTSWFALHPRGKNGKNVLPGGMEYILYLPRWELYSVKDVSIYLHGRHILDESGNNGTGEIPLLKSKEGWIVINAETQEFIDDVHDRLHAVREGSPLLEDMTSDQQCDNPIYVNGTLNINFSLIVNGLMTKGVGAGDKWRSPDSHRVVFCFTEKGHPFRAFRTVVEKFGEDVAETFLYEVGRIAEFLCASMRRLQEKGKNSDPIWTDEERDAKFAAELRRRLRLSENSPMRSDMVAVCCMRVTGTIPRNMEHVDRKNPEQPGYNRSGTFSAVVSGEDGHLYLLQVIVASRRYSKTVGRKGLLKNRSCKI